MLQAPKPPVTSSPKANPQVDKEEQERYSLTQLLNLLQLADRFMDCGKPRLHKLGYHEPAVLYFLQEMSLYLKFHPVQFDAILMRTQEVLQTISTTERLKCEIDHVWARLIKLVFMNANVLNLNDMRVNCSRALYVADLKTLLAKTSFTETLNPETNKVECQITNFDRAAAQTTLYQFMGQLLAVGLGSSVSAIHNYLYLARKAVKAKENGMSAEYIAITIAPTVHDMLLLENVLCPVQDMRKSLHFIATILSCLLQTTRFDTTFEAAVYKDYQQANYNAFFQRMMIVLTDPLCLQELDATLPSQFKKLQLKQPKAIPYTSEAVAASLAKNEEEPIVRAAAARILTKSAASRTLNKEISAEDLEEYHRSMQPSEDDRLAPAATLIFSAQGEPAAVAALEMPITDAPTKDKNKIVRQ